MITAILNFVFGVISQFEVMHIFTDFPDFGILKMIVSFAVTGMIIGLFLGKRKIGVYDPYDPTSSAGTINFYDMD